MAVVVALLLFRLLPNRAEFLCLEANNGLTFGLFLPLEAAPLGSLVVWVAADWSAFSVVAAIEASAFLSLCSCEDVELD